jgi:acetylornithine deacetylase/succinyl-diaminopimelate desuccinylase-like protein
VIVEGPCAIWAASLGSTLFSVRIRSHRGIVHTIKVPFLENPARWLGRLIGELERIELSYAGVGHPLCGPPRVNIGHIVAGDYPNRLPNPIEVHGTWRWTPGMTVADVGTALDQICRRLAAESGLEFEFSLAASREPFETPENHAVVAALQHGVASDRGEPAPVIGMGLVGDANLYANEGGVTTVYYGPAHETAHSDLERVSLAQLTHCARVYAAAAAHFCGSE